jgi:hypothetical protein
MIYLIIYVGLALAIFIISFFLFKLVEKFSPDSEEASIGTKILAASILAAGWPAWLIVFLVSFLISKNK